jgi:hypothetical protein
MFAESGMQNDAVLEDVRFEQPMAEHIRKAYSVSGTSQER